MADVVEEIKSRLSIDEVVSQYVQLKKIGRNFKGLCPFHNEKTPSFIVSPEKQICHCFGCNKGGDIFSFIEEVEGVSFVEAMQILADRAGVKVTSSSFKKNVNKDEKDVYYQAHDLAADFFEKQLHETAEGKKVLDYLYKRGLTDETIREFRLGFAPDSFEVLHSFLLKKGIPKNVLLSSGLAASKGVGDERIYDKYRLRLMFPIFNATGKICGFGGRALQKDQQPKYLNSPENPIYSKSMVIYGLSHAKKYIKEADQVILVEGYFDVILPYQDGVRNVVASSGTAFSAHQAKQIGRLTKSVVSCFDSDDAGFEASKRAYFTFQAENIELRTIAVDKKDPADFVLEKSGGFKALVAQAQDFISFFIEKLLARNDAATLEGRNRVVSELLPCFDGMSPVSRDYFVKELAGKLGMEQKFLYAEIDNFKLPAEHPARLPENSIDASRKMASDILILALLLEYPALFGMTAVLIGDLEFEGDLKNVYKDLTDQYTSARDKFKGWDFDAGFLAKDREKIAVWRLQAEERYSGFSEETLTLELKKLVDRLRKDRKISGLRGLHKAIKEAEESGNREKLRELMTMEQGLLKSH